MDGASSPARGTILPADRDVQPPQRLEFVASFADAQGNTSRHPLAPTWPLEMRGGRGGTFEMLESYLAKLG